MYVGQVVCSSTAPNISETCPLLQNVRVVQRNLVYVVGLALELCYEDLLKTDKYFGQFGKIIKVRTFPATPPLHTHPCCHLGCCRCLDVSLMDQPVQYPSPIPSCWLVT